MSVLASDPEFPYNQPQKTLSLCPCGVWFLCLGISIVTTSVLTGALKCNLEPFSAAGKFNKVWYIHSLHIDIFLSLF